jgi:hypothetical protein
LWLSDRDRNMFSRKAEDDDSLVSPASQMDL